MWSEAMNDLWTLKFVSILILCAHKLDMLKSLMNLLRVPETFKFLRHETGFYLKYTKNHYKIELLQGDSFL